MKRDVLGMGVALVDVLYDVEERFITDNKLLKDCWNMGIRKKDLKYNDSKRLFTIPGGSTGNIIANSAHYGCDNGFIGTVGSDRYGRLYRNDLKRNGIEDFTIRLKGKTNLCRIFVTPDKKRTLITDKGVSTNLRAPEIIPENYKIFHCGMFEIEASKDETLKALEMARNNGQKISFELAGHKVVEKYKDLAETIVKDCDIVFANEEEARAFTGEGPEYSVEELSTKCGIAVVKMGERGSLVKKSDGPIYEIPCTPTRNLVDTTGAGDAYAAGFHLRFLKYIEDDSSVNVERCGYLGSILAAKACEVYGARII